ncbi:MAG TPA: hypothetical protein VIQ30_25125 [Pseudonocardia sp.]
MDQLVQINQVDLTTVDQIVQVVGSLLVLAGFAAAQLGRLSPHSRRYLTLNFIGSAALAVEAALGAQWGFLLLESVWALVSLTALLRAIRAGGSARRSGAGRRGGSAPRSGAARTGG